MHSLHVQGETSLPASADFLEAKGMPWGSKAHVELTVSPVKYQTRKTMPAAVAALHRHPPPVALAPRAHPGTYGQVPSPHDSGSAGDGGYESRGHTRMAPPEAVARLYTGVQLDPPAREDVTTAAADASRQCGARAHGGG